MLKVTFNIYEMDKFYGQFSWAGKSPVMGGGGGGILEVSYKRRLGQCDLFGFTILNFNIFEFSEKWIFLGVWQYIIFWIFFGVPSQKWTVFRFISMHFRVFS